jgi:hypothetical protein
MLKEKKNYEAEAELVVGEETQGAIGRLSQWCLSMAQSAVCRGNCATVLVLEWTVTWKSFFYLKQEGCNPLLCFIKKKNRSSTGPQETKKKGNKENKFNYT